MAARLNYLLQDIAVPSGTFVIGRGPECQLTVDDPMISRRHLALHVGSDTTILEDLDSRNGVFLNGARVHKSEALHDGDVIRVGSADISFHDEEETRDENPAASSSPAGRISRLPGLKTIEEPPFDELTNPMPATLTSGLSVICGVAEKSLALGRADEAERVLQRTLAEILAHAAGPEVDPPLAETAAVYALRLAGATGKGAWIDYALQLYTARKAVPPARVVDELYAAGRKVDHDDSSVRHAFIAQIHEVFADLGPSERFALQRIEAIEPVREGGRNGRAVTERPKPRAPSDPSEREQG
jgi:pSer/pThr/pTyr-binding forkhead associated (FHA) protein